MSIYGAGFTYRRYRTWWIAYLHRGRRVRESSRSHDRTVAEALLRDRLTALQRFPEARRGPGEVRVRLLLDVLRADYALHGRRSLPTLAGHCRVLTAALGGRRIRDLTPERLAECAADWLAAGASPATVNRRFAALRRAVALARKRHLLLAMDVPTFPDRLPERNVRQGFVSQEACAKLQAALADADLRDVVAWAFLTGMRKGAIAQLRWDWFDAETRTLRMPAHLTKNGRGWALVCVADFGAVLARRAARRGPSPLIFHRASGPLGDFRKAWARAVRDAGLPPILFHDLRRTGVRNLLRAGITRHVAMQISGHVTESVFRRYDIVDERDLAQAAEQLGRYLRRRDPQRACAPRLTDGGAGTKDAAQHMTTTGCNSRTG